MDQNGTPTEGHTIKINVTPANQSDVSKDTSPNIAYEYYEEDWAILELPDVDTLTPVNTGNIEQFTLPPSNGELFYGYRYTGKLFVEQAGIYTFYTASNDGSQLHINNSIVVDNNGKHGVLEKQGDVSLAAGMHDISVTYFQSNGSEALHVYWSGANLVKQEITADVLFLP